MIEFTYEKENNNPLYFLPVLVFCENNSFHIIVYRKAFAVSPSPHRLSSRAPNKKLAVFNTCVYSTLIIYSLSNLLKK